jgi:hypothetical protein
MERSLGVRLRLHRERRHVALADIAEQTKIQLSLLQGLEQDDVSRWPAGIFRRSYVRAYAQAIGLDPEPIVREFLAEHPDPQEDLQAMHEAVDQHGRGSVKRPPTRLRFILESAVGLPGGRHTSPQAPTLTSAAQPVNEPLLNAVADLCTRLSQAVHPHEVPPIVEEAGAALEATGLVLWILEEHSAALVPAIVHGYADEIRDRLPAVPTDTDIPIANAFRSGAPCIIKGATGMTGAVIVPLVTPDGCLGVLAIELRGDDARYASIQAAATILAAQLVTLQPRLTYRRSARNAASISS